MRKRVAHTLMGGAVLTLLLGLATAWAAGGKPTIIKPCLQCHKEEPGVLRGQMGTVSEKAETIKIQIGPAFWVVPFDANTELVGAKSFSRIQPGKEIAIHYRDDDGELYATKVYVKPPATVPEEQLIKVEELSPLVDKGPDAGSFTLVDARPAPRYDEGHVPGAISIYDAQFEQNVEKLPEEKSRLLIFYCGGPT